MGFYFKIFFYKFRLTKKLKNSKKKKNKKSVKKKKKKKKKSDEEKSSNQELIRSDIQKFAHCTTVLCEEKPKNSEEFIKFLLFHAEKNKDIFFSMMNLFASIYLDHKFDLWCRDWIDVMVLRFDNENRVFDQTIFCRMAEQLEWAILRYFYLFFYFIFFIFYFLLIFFYFFLFFFFFNNHIFF